MITIIIFTRLDTYTRPYFTKIFPNHKFEQHFNFTYLHYISNDKKSEIIFINDACEIDYYNEIVNVLKKIYPHSIISVYYHISQKAFLKSQMSSIRKILPRGFVELCDHHHGSESKHFKHVLAVGEALFKNDNAKYLTALNILNLHKNG